MPSVLRARSRVRCHGVAANGSRAALTLVPQIMTFVGQYVKGVPRDVYPLIGAVLGYAFRR